MAQRMIHYLIGSLLTDEIRIRDKQRFLLGSVLPDAYCRQEERDKAHFVNKETPGIRFYDFDAFREQFSEHIDNELYLGYYMHLVEDDYYRRFIRVDHELKVYEDPDGVEKLHRDYQILNRYIVTKYHLANELPVEPDLSIEALMETADFDTEPFLQEMENDFTEQIEGSTVFLTEDMLEEYLEKYLPEIKKEFQAVLCGDHYLKAKDFAWQRRPST